MLYTAAPSTCPVGSKPTLRIAVNSSADRDAPHGPLWRISAIRAAAAGGSPERRGSSVTAYLSRSYPTILGASHWYWLVLVVAAFGVPLAVALLGQLEGAAGFLPRRLRPQAVLGPGRAVLRLPR